MGCICRRGADSGTRVDNASVYHCKCTNIVYHNYFAALIIRCKKYYAILVIHCAKFLRIYFRSFERVRKHFDNENFQIYGICSCMRSVQIVGFLQPSSTSILGRNSADGLWRSSQDQQCQLPLARRLPVHSWCAPSRSLVRRCWPWKTCICIAVEGEIKKTQ